MLKYLRRIKARLAKETADQGNAAIHAKYNAYRSLITHNTASLTTLSSLEMLLRDQHPFTIDYFIAGTQSLIASINEIVSSLNALCAGKYQELFDTVSRVGADVLVGLNHKRSFDNHDLVLPLPSLDRHRQGDVGGKAANLGEIHNQVHLPTPRGFAITAYACRHFLEANHLLQTIDHIITSLSIEDTPRLEQACQQIRDLIMAAALPPDLEEAILEAADQLEAAAGPGLRLSVRSSATSEDSEASFAGQYSSVLNVSRQTILEAYKEVVASTFTPRAVSYRRRKGYAEDDVIMSALCLAMVDSVTSGVMYTVDPTDHGLHDLIITAAWGLGVSVVDGSAAVDIYRVSRDQLGHISREVAQKQQRVVMAQSQGLAHEEVPPDLRAQACLSDGELTRLAEFGLRLEGHYGQPLDIEWAKDPEGGLIILQARPLNPLEAQALPEDAETSWDEPALAGHPSLLAGGHCASPGVAAGLTHVLFGEQDLAGVPEGSILVAPQTSPAFVSIMGKLKGIVTDLGSVTGHMASVAREFQLPTLVATDKATQMIPSGQEVTLDATHRVVYLGRVEPLLRQKRLGNPMEGGPVYALARTAMDKIAPLTLTDPHAPCFTPRGCVTLHDIIRLAHEISMREMFRVGDYLEGREGGAVRLRMHLPIILYCVDLGGGLRQAHGRMSANLEDITSTPFTALLKGMTNQNLRWAGAVGMSMSGMVSLMAQSVLSDPTHEHRFGGPNYAVISKEYLNFNARLGYHFAVVDSYCGPAPEENYISFAFKGGAANLERKGRRARLIALILERFGMAVQLKGDMIRGELREGKSEQMSDRLDHLGRLLGAVRLLDMAIADDSQIGWYADEFFKGNYAFARE